MKPEKKHLIKYMSDSVKGPASHKILYWDKSSERWCTDPNQATRFINPEGISEVGRLLVEHEWVTRMIPEDEVPMVKPISPPNSGFILVVDCDGDPQEVFPGNTNLDQVFQTIQKLDRDSGYHPHSAWSWGTGGFSRVFERIDLKKEEKP